MANNELSGPCVTSFIAKKLVEMPQRRYTYRIVFVPETIGSITYLAKNLELLKERVIAGYNISCVGDDRDYSYLPSRHGNTLSDKVARHVLQNIAPNYKAYTWNDRGSDERQYCSPGVDLPIATIARTLYGKYKEYHTSLDDLSNVVTPKGLEGGFNAIYRALEVFENNCYPKVTVLGEPQLGRRGLYPRISSPCAYSSVKLLNDVISRCDGFTSLLQISELCQCAIWDLYPIINMLSDAGLITVEKEFLKTTVP
jgi:aminopeptidase-like protein